MEIVEKEVYLPNNLRPCVILLTIAFQPLDQNGSWENQEAGPNHVECPLPPIPSQVPNVCMLKSYQDVRDVCPFASCVKGRG